MRRLGPHLRSQLIAVQGCASSVGSALGLTGQTGGGVL